MSLINLILKIFGNAKTYAVTTYNETIDNGLVPAFTYHYKNDKKDCVYFTQYYKVIIVDNISYYFDRFQTRQIERVIMKRDNNGNALPRCLGFVQSARPISLKVLVTNITYALRKVSHNKQKLVA